MIMLAMTLRLVCPFLCMKKGAPVTQRAFDQIAV